MKAKQCIRLSVARIQVTGILAQSPFYNGQQLCLALHREQGLTAQKSSSILSE